MNTWMCIGVVKTFLCYSRKRRSQLSDTGRHHISLWLKSLLDRCVGVLGGVWLEWVVCGCGWCVAVGGVWLWVECGCGCDNHSTSPVDTRITIHARHGSCGWADLHTWYVGFVEIALNPLMIIVTYMCTLFGDWLISSVGSDVIATASSFCVAEVFRSLMRKRWISNRCS